VVVVVVEIAVGDIPVAGNNLLVVAEGSLAVDILVVGILVAGILVVGILVVGTLVVDNLEADNLGADNLVVVDNPAVGSLAEDIVVPV